MTPSAPDPPQTAPSMYTRARLSGSEVSAGSVAVGLGVAVGAGVPVVSDAGVGAGVLGGAGAVSCAVSERGVRVEVASAPVQASKNIVPTISNKKKTRLGP